MCRGVGDLVLVYRRVTGLAGHTSRVSELLEQVCSCSVPLSLTLLQLALAPDDCHHQRAVVLNQMRLGSTAPQGLDRKLYDMVP